MSQHSGKETTLTHTSRTWPHGEPPRVRQAADTPRGIRRMHTIPGGDSDAQSDSDGYHGQGC